MEKLTATEIDEILTVMRKHDVSAFDIGEFRVTLNPKIEKEKPEYRNPDDFGHYNRGFDREADKAGL